MGIGSNLFRVLFGVLFMLGIAEAVLAQYIVKYIWLPLSPFRPWRPENLSSRQVSMFVFTMRVAGIIISVASLFMLLSDKS